MTVGKFFHMIWQNQKFLLPLPFSAKWYIFLHIFIHITTSFQHCRSFINLLQKILVAGPCQMYGGSVWWYKYAIENNAIIHLFMTCHRQQNWHLLILWSDLILVPCVIICLFHFHYLHTRWHDDNYLLYFMAFWLTYSSIRFYLINAIKVIYTDSLQASLHWFKTYLCKL